MATARIGRLILLLLMPAATGCRPDATHGDAEDTGRPPLSAVPPASRLFFHQRYTTVNQKLSSPQQESLPE